MAAVVIVTPWWTVGAWASLDTRDTPPALGLAFADHLEAFDGRP